MTAAAMLIGMQDQQWFGMLEHADVILDTYPFGGYTTTLEAWAVGAAPVVTLPHEVRSNWWITRC